MENVLCPRLLLSVYKLTALSLALTNEFNSTFHLASTLANPFLAKSAFLYQTKLVWRE